MNNSIDESNEVIMNTEVSPLAMTVALISFSMLFATLILGYFIFRFSNSAWPPIGVPKISLSMPLISTFFILISSIGIEFAKYYFKKSNVRLLRRTILAVIFFGGCYFISQINFWTYLNVINLATHTGIYASILHGFTWIHSFHVACAVVLLISIFFLSFKERFSGFHYGFVMNSFTFWHFLTLLWLLLFLIMFVF